MIGWKKCYKMHRAAFCLVWSVRSDIYVYISTRIQTLRNTHARSSSGRGERVKSVYMFVFLSAFSSMVPLIGRRAAWSDDAMRQRQPMWCAILLSHRPSLIPASRPCLYVTAVMPAVSHSTGAVCGVCVCVCIYARVCVHMCVVALTNLFIPWPPCLHW